MIARLLWALGTVVGAWNLVLAYESRGLVRASLTLAGAVSLATVARDLWRMRAHGGRS